MSIRKLYDAKKLTAKRNGASWMVAFPELYMEPGYNIRDGEIDQERVAAFADAFLADDYVPPITVDVTDKGLRVNDGQHRYLGAKMAIGMGKANVMLEVVDVTDKPEAVKVGRMVTANDGTPTSPIARANAYARMKAEGMTNDQIAKEVKRSPSDVANFLALASCPDHLKEMVKAGQMSYVMAIDLAKEHGENAPAVAAEALAEAKAAGKEKVTKKFTKPKEPAPASEAAQAPEEPEQPQPAEPKAAKPSPFSAAKAMRVVELATQIERVHDEKRLAIAAADESMTLRVPAGVLRELATLLDEYLGEA